MKKIYALLFVIMITGFSFSQTNANEELIFLKLRASTTSNSYTTDFYFNPNASLGFDFGYDAGVFGLTPDFAIYSNLVEDNVGDDISLQAVNTTDLANVIIPLGVNAYQAQELTISIHTSTLPGNIEVYLDDTLANTSTPLNSSNFVITPTANLSGTGRFFLRILTPSTTYTYNDSWTPSDPNGVAISVDDLVIVSGDAIFNTNTVCNTVTVNPGASATVNSGITLTTTSGLTLASNSTSYSSLIRNGSIVGSLNYERHVNINGSGSTGSNDLISAPLTGEAFNTFATSNPNILNNGTLYLFGPFEKVTGTYVTWDVTETATLDPGVGYRAATSDNSTVTFTGSANNGIITNDIVNSGTNNEEWNLVGNPYPSYLNVQQFLSHDVGGVVNIQLFDAPTAAIYGYDGTALNGWTVYNLANTSASTKIAPGQGFFVSADATNAPLYDLEFTPAMRSTGTGDDFIAGRNAELTYIKLNASATNKSYNTEFYFNANATEGFDVGYDAALWGNTTPEFALYSHLIENNAGDAITLQTLNSADLDDASIPLGVKANQGEQLTFSIADMNVPAATKVYLEDVVANTTTMLNNADYVITPTSDLNGTGRFFLRTAQGALASVENNLDNLNIFALNTSKEVVVSGQLKDQATISLYDIQGRIVLSTELNDTTLENRIDVSSLNGGVYVVTVRNNDQQKTQKVVIK